MTRSRESPLLSVPSGRFDASDPVAARLSEPKPTVRPGRDAGGIAASFAKLELADAPLVVIRLARSTRSPPASLLRAPMSSDRRGRHLRPEAFACDRRAPAPIDYAPTRDEAAPGIRTHGSRGSPLRFGSTTPSQGPAFSPQRPITSPNYPRRFPRAGEPRRRTLRFAGGNRVSDGTRTRGRRDHNPELYQLSYAHQDGLSIAPLRRPQRRRERSARAIRIAC